MFEITYKNCQKISANGKKVEIPSQEEKSNIFVLSFEKTVENLKKEKIKLILVSYKRPLHSKTLVIKINESIQDNMINCRSAQFTKIYVTLKVRC